MPCKVGVDADSIYFSIRPVWLTRILAPALTKPVKLPLNEVRFDRDVRFGQDVVIFHATMYAFSFVVPWEVGRRVVARVLNRQ